LDGACAEITIKLVSEQINTTRDQDGSVVNGDPDKTSGVTDIWTFARDTSLQDPNWRLIATRSLD
jgi:predicted lipid-binding transport protein (Tim44 family)